MDLQSRPEKPRNDQEKSKAPIFLSSSLSRKGKKKDKTLEQMLERDGVGRYGNVMRMRGKWGWGGGIKRQ